MKNLRLFVEVMLLSLFVVQILGCSSQQKRTKWSDPVMRVMINPEGIDAASYARIQVALVATGKFWVIDRGMAFKAAVNEQNMTRLEAPERFHDEEKFARLKQLYGVGGVIQAHVQCASRRTLLWGDKSFCQEYLSIVSTNTGEVLAAAEDEQKQQVVITYTEWHMQSPPWEDVVNKLVDAFPEHFEEQKWTPEMKQYKQVVKEEAIREKEAKEGN